MPRIKRFTERLSFYILPDMQKWYAQRSQQTQRPASELYREALEKYARLTDRMEGGDNE